MRRAAPSSDREPAATRTFRHASVRGGDTPLPPGIAARLHAENALDEELYQRARAREAKRTERWRAGCVT